MHLRSLSLLACATGCLAGGPRITTALPAVPAADHAHVRITTDDGSVRVVTADVAQVEMHVESRGYDVASDLELAVIPRGGDVDVIARTRHRAGFGSRSLHIDVIVPRDASLEVRSGDGAVELEQIAGDVDVRTGDGSVEVRGARGGIRLATGDGSIRASGLDGSVEARSGDGSVHLDGRFDALTVETHDGQLVANAWPGSRVLQPWQLRAHDGSVTLGLPADLGAHVEASSGDGSIHSTIPSVRADGSHAEGDVHGGGPPIVVRSGDGAIRLTQLVAGR